MNGAAGTLCGRSVLSGIILEEDLIADLVFLGIPPGSDPGEMAEGADEVGVVGESGALAGLLDADAVLQELAGPEDPAIDDIFHDGEAGGRLEDAAQVVLADIKAAGDLIQVHGIGHILVGHIHQPDQLIGKTAAQFLLDRLDGYRGDPRTARLKCRISPE